MPPRKQATSPAAAPPSAAAATSGFPSAAGSNAAPPSTATKAASSASGQAKIQGNDAQAIAAGIWRNYQAKTDQRTKLLDVFMAFLVVVGALQFIYCVIGGNYPFNAFLSGFSATVGQFVLTASLRIQTNPENKADFESISHERAFADYIFGSVILHFFCVNFIN
ncbi:DAD family-domain-containing protein [Phyllosticta citribraziliensis]|uniref:Dolichyl-diphosphooligosaccharide--protein glycosyltransferase subunit OST2 n=1 Tax=Phyllosticta citribraziliensis TaxID=989973 RepID=A0ABR1M1J9_9PEZI